jgi:release factor glutamine methyltransferase
MRLVPLPGVFQPPSDSWMLAGTVRRQPLPPDAAALDLCTGSGVIAVAAGLAGAGSVTAVDVSRRAVLAARLNGALNGLRIDARRGDLFEAVGERRFDLITANPPYVPTPSGEIPERGLARAWEGGPDGRVLLDRICAGARAHLRPGGTILLVHSAVCGESATVGALEAGGLRVDVVLRHRGTLGPLLRDRAAWLRERGLLGPHDEEEMLVIRGRAPVAEPEIAGLAPALATR